MKHLSDPKLLLSVAIALAQLGTFLWRTWRESGKRHQMDEIRAEIVKLSEFLAKTGDIADNPEGREAVEAASAERKELVARLNKLARVPAAGQTTVALANPVLRRPLWAKLTLFYLASNVAGWMMQFSFYFWLLVTSVAALDDEHDETGMFVFAGFLIAISWLLARIVDRARGQPRDRPRLQRLFLSFPPAGRIAVAVHAAYWLTCFFVAIGLIGVGLMFWEKDPDAWSGALGMGFFAAFGIAVRAAALVLDQQQPLVETPERAASAAGGSTQ